MLAVAEGAMFRQPKGTIFEKGERESVPIMPNIALT